jgi:hypothetical protein
LTQGTQFSRQDNVGLPVGHRLRAIWVRRFSFAEIQMISQPPAETAAMQQVSIVSIAGYAPLSFCIPTLLAKGYKSSGCLWFNHGTSDEKHSKNSRLLADAPTQQSNLPLLF